MPQSLLTADMIAEFRSKGGAVKRLKAGASTGITTKEWERLVRGEAEPVEVPALIEAHVAKQASKPLRLRAGFGAR